jgi:transcriptional regulator with XRE-family HTH domain
MAKTKASNAIDAHVGSRVRMRRMMLGMSQEKLGDALGLTFQQVQKYEKGTNRMGASRLQQAADILGVAVPFFFEGAVGGTYKPDGSAPSANTEARRTASYRRARERDRGWGLRCLKSSRSAPSFTTAPRIVGTARPMACT